MGDHLSLERYYWFDNQVRSGRFPNANTLAERFEVSSKTAQRSIDYSESQIPSFDMMALCGPGISGGFLCLRSKPICGVHGDVRPFCPQNAASQEISGSPPPCVHGISYQLGRPRPPQSSSTQHPVPGFPLTRNGGFPYVPAI